MISRLRITKRQLSRARVVNRRKDADHTLRFQAQPTASVEVKGIIQMAATIGY